MAHGHFWCWMSLSRVKPFSQSAWRGVAIFASLIIEEFTTKSSHHGPPEREKPLQKQGKQNNGFCTACRSERTRANARRNGNVEICSTCLKPRIWMATKLSTSTTSPFVLLPLPRFCSSQLQTPIFHFTAQLLRNRKQRFHALPLHIAEISCASLSRCHLQ